MEKLSRAGRLYLKDFYILQEAQSDVFNFLNEVVEKTYQRFLEKIEILPVPQNFTWQVWNNQSSPGMMQVYPTALKEFGLFKKGKTDLYLQYLDARHDSEMDETNTVRIIISSTNVFRKVLRRLSHEEFEKATEEASAQDTSLSLNNG